MGTVSNADACVLSRQLEQALPALWAKRQLAAHTPLVTIYQPGKAEGA
jgi:hypothetical protein